MFHPQELLPYGLKNDPRSLSGVFVPADERPKDAQSESVSFVDKDTGRWEYII